MADWWSDDTLRPPGTEDDDMATPLATTIEKNSVKKVANKSNAGDICPPGTEDANASVFKQVCSVSTNCDASILYSFFLFIQGRSFRYFFLSHFVG